MLTKLAEKLIICVVLEGEGSEPRQGPGEPHSLDGAEEGRPGKVEGQTELETLQAAHPGHVPDDVVPHTAGDLHHVEMGDQGVAHQGYQEQVGGRVVRGSPSLNLSGLMKGLQQGLQDVWDEVSRDIEEVPEAPPQGELGGVLLCGG